MTEQSNDAIVNLRLNVNSTLHKTEGVGKLG